MSQLNDLPSAFTRFKVEPYTPNIGAVIHGLDLRQPLDEATQAELRTALARHEVIFFRDQTLTPEQQLAFGRRFGPLNIHPYVKGMADHPEVIQACAENGWEFYSHGTYNTRYLMGMDEAQERAVIQDSIDTIKKHTGQKLDGWLAPALTYTERTMDLVAEMGLTYVCDLFHDDQPGPVKVKKGKLTSIPYSLEMNDTIVYNVNLVSPRRYADILKRQFDRLYAEGEHSGTVMCIPLHPYLIGQPYRLAAFEEALSYITSHDKVWLATGREIAAHYNAHYHDAFAAAALPVGEAP